MASFPINQSIAIFSRAHIRMISKSSLDTEDLINDAVLPPHEEITF